MKKINTSPISGMQEFLPSTQALFNTCKTRIVEVYHRHGFLNIETPTIDRNEILFAKAGGDTEKQIYRVIKTDESAEDSTQSLRFDHTVPLARYVVEHENDLSFPFFVSQIGKNYRGERAQKGRFREFYQCDIDIIGRNKLPIFYDAQVVYVFYTALSSIVNSPIRIRLNNRKLVSGFIEAIGATDFANDIFSIIDHAEKVPQEKTIEYLRELGLAEEDVVKITTFIDAHGNIEKIRQMLEEFGFIGNDNSNDSLSTGFSELEDVIAELNKMGLDEKQVEIDLKIVRGLDYYTGTVFEGVLSDYPEIGSIGGGGRYENLASNFSEQKFPGVGASIGLSRLFYILKENNLLEEKADDFAPVEYAIMPMSDGEFETAYKLAKALRSDGKSALVLPVEKKLGDTLRVATKNAKKGIVIGENEVKNQLCMVKDFSTSDQTPLNFNKYF